MNMPDMPDALKKLFTGVGVLAEMAKLHNDAFVNAGFSEEDALYLTGICVDSMMQMSAGNKNKIEEL